MWIKVRLKQQPSAVVDLHVIPHKKYLRVSGHTSKQVFVNLISEIVNQTDWPPGGKKKVLEIFRHEMRNPEMRIEPRRNGDVTVTMLGEAGAIFSSADSCALVR